MKKLVLKIAFILISVGVMAQQEINTTFGQQMATMFGTLERNRVPHGLLLDLSMEFTNVSAHNCKLSNNIINEYSTIMYNDTT